MPSLALHQLRCANLPNEDVFSLSDPFVTLRCGPHVLRTRTIRNSLDPVWPEALTLDLPALSVSNGTVDSELLIEVYDEDVVADDFLGGCSLKLSDVSFMRPLQVSLPLQLPRAADPSKQSAGTGPPSVSFVLVLSPNPVTALVTSHQLPPIGGHSPGAVAVDPTGRGAEYAAQSAAAAQGAAAPGGVDALPAIGGSKAGTATADVPGRAPKSQFVPPSMKSQIEAIVGQPVRMGTVRVQQSRLPSPRTSLAGTAALVDLLHRYYDANLDGGLDLRELEVIIAHFELPTKQQESTHVRMQRYAQYGPDAVHPQYGLTPYGLHLLMDDVLNAETDPMALDLLGTQPNDPLALRFLLDEYEVGKTLGSGKFATVAECWRRSDGAKFACKCMDKTKAGAKGVEAAYVERLILMELRHPCVLQLIDFYETPYTVYFILELVVGGELFDRIVSLQFYSERTAAVLFKNLIRTMRYLHAHSVVHRDIKPENILLTHPEGAAADAVAGAAQADPSAETPPVPFLMPGEEEDFAVAMGSLHLTAHGASGPSNLRRGSSALPTEVRVNSSIKLADFGFATKAKTPTSLTECCGTPTFIAPEVLNHGYYRRQSHGYGCPADMWSCGVILYVLLCGYPPFHGSSRSKLFDRIVAGQFAFHPNTPWDSVSREAKDLVTRLLVLNPNERMTAADALKHPWLRDLSSVSDAPFSKELQSSFCHFASRYKVKGMVFGVEAVSRLRYLQICKQYGVKANSALLNELRDQIRPMDCLDLSRNYVGANAAKAVVALANEVSHIHAVSLSENYMTDEHIKGICDMLRERIEGTGENPTIIFLDLSHNPISAIGANHLIELAQIMPSLIKINLEHTSVPGLVATKLRGQLEHNRRSGVAERLLSAPTPPKHTRMSA